MARSVKSKLETRLQSRVLWLQSAGTLLRKLWKASKVVIAGVLIGAFDAWQSKYLHVGQYGKEAAIVYEVALIVVSGIAAVAALYDTRWNKYRNALSLLLTIPIATISDNVSLDLQVMKPYFIILPRAGYLWRLHVFNHTFLYPLANWVDMQTFGPGLINGYVSAIALAGLYITLQIAWDRFKLESIIRALLPSRLLSSVTSRKG